MVTSATSMGRTGLQDWLLQRLSALIVTTYTVFLVVYFYQHNAITFNAWQALFQNQWMKLSTALVALSVLIHGWIGLWTISTDYLKKSCHRLFFQFIVFLTLLASFLWVITILWSI